MVAQYTNVKKFRDFLGVDLKSTDIKRGPQFASGGKNVDFTINNSIKKRRGFQYKNTNSNNAGLVTYAKVDSDGIPAPELVSIGESVKRLITRNLDITYTGAGEARIELILDSTTSLFRFRLIEDNVDKLSLSLGDGVSTVVTIASLISAITAVSGFIASSPGDTSQPAAFLEIVREEIFTTKALAYSYFEDINTGATTMLGNTSLLGNSNYENASHVNLNNVLYISNRENGLYKYDGQTFYRAGMPIGVEPAVALGGAGALTGAYVYAHTYLQIDNQGQVIEGNISPNSSTISPAAQSVDLTLDNIAASSGFNTNCAIVAGAQATVTTILVDDGSGGSHTMKVGDTAYFFDSVSGQYVTREVTAVTGSSITIEGAAVTVADNAVISNNLRIAIYRTVAGGVTKFFVAEIPNNSFATTQVYNDNLVDGSLGGAYVTPRYGHDLPPSGQYLATYRNLLVVAGSKTLPNRVYFSDSDGPEYFPTASHAFDVNTKIGDIITGLGVNNDQLVIFKEQSIFVAAGDFGNLNFVVDQLTSGDLGCVAHATIQEVREGVLYFLTSRGPYQIVGGQLPSPVGPTVSDSGQVFSRIETFFTDLNQDADVLPVTKRAVAINWPDEAKYILFIPSEDTGANADANVNSTVWVFDYSRGAWLPEWTNINAAAGLAVINNALYWASRDSTSDYLATFLNTNDEYDYADHTAAIEWVYEDSWIHLGYPNINKKFLKLVMMVLDEIESATWTITVDMGVEFYKDVTWASLDVPFGNSDAVGWGLGGWGEFPWGETVNVNRKLKLKSNKTKAFRPVFKNSDLHKNVLLTGWEVEVAAPYREIR